MDSTVFVDDFKRIITKIFQNIPAYHQKNATINLLKSSLAISISGAFRVYIACLLLQTQPSALICIAGGLIIYSVYTLDRTMESEEDRVNRKELSGYKKEIGFAASVITFLIGSWTLATEGDLTFAFLPLIIGFLYSKGIKIGKFALKLKGGLGAKNIVVGLTWGIFIVGLAYGACKSILAIGAVFLLYGVKTCVNSIIDDFKDIEGDTLAGIKTLPVIFGARNTRNFLLGLHLLSHLILGIALIKGLIAFEPVIVLCSLICGRVCIQRYTNEVEYISRKSEMTFFKDGEAALIIILRIGAGLLL